MEFKVLLRATEDWDKFDVDNYHYEIYSKQNHQYRLNVQAWEHLNIDYFQYRHRMKSIVLRHWFHPWMHFCHWRDFVGREDVVLAPIDDDDIHHPDLFQHLRDAFSDPGVKLVSWNTWVLDLCHSCRVYEFPAAQYKWVHSNCYALRGDILTSTLLKSHTDVLRNDSLYLPLNLALRMEHPAGIWHHRKKKTIRDRFCISEWKELQLPKDLQWATGVIREVTELTKFLKWKTILYL